MKIFEERSNNHMSGNLKHFCMVPHVSE